MPAGSAYPSGHLVPSPILGLANAPIVETKFLELAMSLLDFSPRIPLGTISILLNQTSQLSKLIAPMSFVFYCTCDAIGVFCVACDFVRRLSVCLSVCPYGSQTFCVVTHDSYVSQATHAFLGMLQLYCFISKKMRNMHRMYVAFVFEKGRTENTLIGLCVSFCFRAHY